MRRQTGPGFEHIRRGEKPILILMDEVLVKKRAKKTTVGKRKKKTVKSARSAVPSWRDVLLTTDEAGAAVKIGGERIRQRTKEGWINKVDHNSYRLGEVIDGELRYREDQLRKAEADTESSRLAASKRRLVDLRIAQEENRLVEAEDVQTLVTEIVGGFVSELRGVPAGATRDHAVREAIEEVLNGAIDRCRARFEKLGADLRSGRGIVLEEQEGDA